MDAKLLAPLFAIALAIGWFFPDSEPPQSMPPQAGESAAKPSIASATSRPAPDLGYDPVIIDRTADGHFYATASIRGAPVRFLIDTGASMIALTGDDARNLGFTWSQDELQPVGRGASGDVVGKPVMLESVAVGDVEFSNLAAVIIPEGLDVSLLGQSFLGRIDNVKIERDRMTLGG